MIMAVSERLVHQIKKTKTSLTDSKGQSEVQGVGAGEAAASATTFTARCGPSRAPARAPAS